MKKTWVWLCSATLALLLAPVAASAAPKVGDVFGDWVFECMALAEGKTLCALSQSLVSQQDNRRLVKFSLARNEKNNEVMLTALLPLGIHLPQGVQGSIDQGKAFPFTLQTCTQQGCIASFKTDKDMVKRLKAGQKVAVSFSVAGGKRPITLTGSLKGLAAGIKAAGLE
jgi:invasion protein IalB